MQKLHNKEKGKRAEQLAVAFLRSKNYQILATNYRYSRMGELDVVCMKDQTVIFVEVKYRTNNRKGRPEEAITLNKCRQIYKLAHVFIHRQRLYNLKVRFDVISVMSENFNKYCEIIHYQSMFP